MKELEKIIARTLCFMPQSFYRPNYIFNNDAYFLDFRAQKFPLNFFNVNPVLGPRLMSQWLFLEKHCHCSSALIYGPILILYHTNV